MFRPTITDMQDKYCGDRYDTYRIQSRHKGNYTRCGTAEGRNTSFVVAAEGRHLCTSVLRVDADNTTLLPKNYIATDKRGPQKWKLLKPPAGPLDLAGASKCCDFHDCV